MKKNWFYLLVTVLFGMSLASNVYGKEKLRVVSSFSILGDMVHQIAGNEVHSDTLVGPNGDTHVFKPSPFDAEKVASANVLIINGLEFEGWIERLQESSEFSGKLVIATSGIDKIRMEEEEHHDEHGKDEHHDEHEEEHHDEHGKDDHHDGDHAFEWAGAFKLSAGEYVWTFAKVDGDYADPKMKMVILASKLDGEAAIEEREEMAEGLIKSHGAIDRNHGEALTPNDGNAYQLAFDSNRNVTEFRVMIKKEGVYTFFTEHMPFEFEADEHFFKNTEKQDIEPIAQEPDAGHHHHHHGEFDPHGWNSIANAKIYVENIRKALVEAVPAKASIFNKNADAYLKKLNALEKTLKSEIKQIPKDRRKVITAHDAFGYLGRDFGLEFMAPQGQSTESEASAKDVARIIKLIREHKIKAVFVESISDPRLIEQIARETGAVVGGKLYPGALSEPDGPASTYLKLMEHNVRTIIKALK